MHLRDRQLRPLRKGVGEEEEEFALDLTVENEKGFRARE